MVYVDIGSIPTVKRPSAPPKAKPEKKGDNIGEKHKPYKRPAGMAQEFRFLSIYSYRFFVPIFYLWVICFATF